MLLFDSAKSRTIKQTIIDRWLKSDSLKRSVRNIEEDEYSKRYEWSPNKYTLNELSLVNCVNRIYQRLSVQISKPSSSNSNLKNVHSKNEYNSIYNSEYLQSRFTFAASEDIKIILWKKIDIWADCVEENFFCNFPTSEGFSVDTTAHKERNIRTHIQHDH